MIRSICTALVILGLVFQPLAVAWAAPMAGHGMDGAVSSVSTEIDKGHHGMTMADADSSIPCQEANLADSLMDASEDCCGTDCPMIGQCTNSCAVNPFAVISKSTFTFEPGLSGSLISPATIYPDGRSSFIFHPPKHS